MSVLSERIKLIAQKRRITITSIAKEIHVSHRHLCRLLSQGEMSSEYLNKICEVLDINSKYITGETDRIGRRIEDFYSVDVIKDSLKKIMMFSEMGHYVEKIDDLQGMEIEDIVSILVAYIDSPEDFFKLVSMEDIDRIHHNKVFERKEN